MAPTPLPVVPVLIRRGYWRGAHIRPAGSGWVHGDTPKVVHETREAAEQEADRINAETPRSERAAHVDAYPCAWTDDRRWLPNQPWHWHVGRQRACPLTR